MTKNYFFGLAALASAFALTSCSNDDMPSVANGEGLIFRVEMPTDLTRAFADGKTADNLYVAVYDEDNTLLMSNFTDNLENADAITVAGYNAGAPGVNPSWTVTIPLVKNAKYNVVFWAQADGAPYAYNATAQEITVDYTGALSGDESRDAFYTFEQGVLSNGETHNVTLYRPFAQINIGTDDLAAAKAAGLDVTQAGVGFSSLASKLNLATGETSEIVNDVKFGPAALPADEVFPVAGYDYLAMAYVLAPAASKSEKSIIDSVDLYVNAATPAFLSYANIPAQGNYRTNIYGSLLTNREKFIVEIEPSFETPDYEIEYTPATPAEFATALASPVASKINVEKDLDLTGLTQEELTLTAPKAIVMADDATVTLPTNACLETSTDLTIEGGTLTNETDNLTPAPDGSLALIHAYGGELVIRNCTVANDKDYFWHGTTYNNAAIAYWNDTNVTIENSTITARGYTLCGMGRGVASGVVTLRNSTFESTSSNGDKDENGNGGHWSYALRVFGSSGVADNCTVIGIQGGLSVENIEFTINGGIYTTHNSEGKQDAFYPVYATNGAVVTVNGGYFYGPRANAACEGTMALIAGDNDIALPTGAFIVNGGFMSGKAYNTTTKKVYEPSAGFSYVETNTEANGLTYKWSVVK